MFHAGGLRRLGVSHDAPAIQVLALEIDHGPFERVLELPAEVEPKNVTAEHGNGLLWIRLPIRTQGKSGNVLAREFHAARAIYQHAVGARSRFVPRQLGENGLKPDQCEIEREALMRIIEDYTREAGVRELERRIAAVCRSVAALFAKGERRDPMRIDAAMVQSILGPPKYVRETRLKTGNPGVVTGLAWTPAGGEILHIEALRYPGKGGILLTGQIGGVMEESAQAALSLVKSRAHALGIEPDVFRDTDIHVHVPAGAVPKDGPSAGVAMFTAIASLFSDRPVRPDVAMTGEISLRGLVLPIGGLKEKSLAALRAEVTTVIIPKLNEKDLADVPREVKEKLEFVFAENVDDVLSAALETPVEAH